MTHSSAIPSRISTALFFASLLLVACAVFITSASIAEAQTVFSASAQQSYDSNVFLENDDDISLLPLPEGTTLEDFTSLLDERANADPDEDFITNLSLGVSTAPEISPHVKTGVELRGGFLFFQDFSDEDRFTLDALIKVDAEKSLIPDPFYLGVTADLRSNQSDVTVAEGTAARQSEVFSAGLGTGVREIPIAALTALDVGYNFNYSNSLGEFLIDSDKDPLFEEEGSDFISNFLNLQVQNQVQENLTGNLRVDFGYLDYIKIENQNGISSEDSESELDRLEGRSTVGFNYAASEQVGLFADIGVGVSRLADEPEPITATAVAPDGTTVEVESERDRNLTSLIYSAGLSYAPEPTLNFVLAADQSQSSNIDGERVITRGIALNASKAIGNRYTLAAGGRFSQYDQNESTVSDGTDRVEAFATASYALTEAISLAIGYSFVDQNADDEELTIFNIRSSDYDSHRAFVSLSAGFVGIPTF